MKEQSRLSVAVIIHLFSYAMFFLTLVIVIPKAYGAFSNNFDGASSSPGADVSWGPPFTCSSCTGTPPVESTDIAKSPPHSLKFTFGGGPLADSAQYFNFSTDKQEVWVQWWQYFPCSDDTPLTCTDTTEWQQNAATSSIEFIKLWRGTIGEEVDANALRAELIFYPKATYPGDSIIRPFIYPTTPVPALDDDLVGIRRSYEKGEWVRFLYHAKGSNNSTIPYDGIIELGIYDGLVYNERIKRANVPLIDAIGNNFFNRGKFMGRAQGGFTATPMVTYIDDVYISDRPPLSLVLVLDRSGSMNGHIIPGDASSNTKFTVLKQAANIFIDELVPYVTFADRAGVVYFNQNVIDSVLFLDPSSALAVTNLHAKVDGQASGGGRTSIGDGLLSAKVGGFETYPNPREVIFLFTDGYQNEPQWVVEDNANPDVPFPTTDRALTTSSSDRFDLSGTIFPDQYDICVVGIGSGTAQRAAFNRGLAVKRCGNTNGNGRPAIEIPDLTLITAISEAFNQLLEDIGIGDKIEQSKVVSGFYDPQKKENVEKFTVSQKDVRLSITLLWSDLEISSDSLKVKLVGPSPKRTEFDAAPYTKYGKGYQVISFPLPLEETKLTDFKGHWDLVMNAHSENLKGFDYGLLIMNDNQTIASKYKVEGIDFGTGEVIPLRIDLREAGKPILNANVTVEVASPDNGVGNVLSTNTAPRHKLTTTTTSAINTTTALIDPLSPVEKKLEALLQNPEIRAQLIPSLRPDVTLKDDDGDGIYTGQYTITDQEGIYSFRFLVEGTTPDNGDFTRTQKLTVNVRPKPDPVQTEAIIDIDKDTDDAKGRAILKFTPYDKFKNYLGPGYADFIKVVVTHDGKDMTDDVKIGEMVDNLDGSYQQEINISDLSKKARINITLRGEKVVNKSVSQLLPIWWFWWLLLILLLILIVIQAIILFMRSS